jgi:hydroxyacylglutathione hydrolase
MSAPSFYRSSLNSKACADVFLCPMFSDNYGHIIVDRATNKAALIDPAEPAVVINAVKELGVDVQYALITHKHGDHCGGNAGVKSAIPQIQVIGTAYEDVPDLTGTIREGDELTLGGLKISVLHVPCHTKGHVAYYVTPADGNTKGDPVLFPGDTLFVGGCGRFFEGTADEMLRNMDRFGQLPAETQVFCAHEYTTSNLKFLSSVDPEKSSPVLEAVEKTRSEGLPTLPSTIGHELSYNLFMKCREPRTQSLVFGAAGGSPVDTMAKLRDMKNRF